MIWWEILEIPYDSDIKSIKKAYSKLLKVNNPEDNPQGYQRLREAYEEAKKYAKKNNKAQGNQEIINGIFDGNIINEVENFNAHEPIAEININEEKQIIIQNEIDVNKSDVDIKESKSSLPNKISRFLNKLDDIYKDLNLRCDLESWEELLNSDVIWNVDAFPIIKEELFNFLTKHKYLPGEIWIKLNNNFAWSKNEIKLYNEYPDFIVDELLKKLKKPSKLKYDFIKSMNPEIADEYLYEREQAEKALKERKYANAYNHMKKAYTLFEGDSELLRLKGDYYYDLNQLERAYNQYKAAIDINNYDYISALHLGIILTSQMEFSDAVKYLSLYLSNNSDDKLAIKHIAYCYYYNDDFVQAKIYFQKLLDFEENNKIAKKYLKNIEAKLAGKYARKILFDRETFIKEEVVEKESKLNMKGKTYKTITFTSIPLARVIIIIAIFHGIKYSNEAMNPSKYKNTQNNIIHENQNKDNKKVDNDANKNKKTSKSLEKTILDPVNKQSVGMDLYNVKPTNYYKLAEPFKNKRIFSKAELDENGLQDKVESQLHVGSTKENVVIFSDAKCSEKTIKSDGKYRINGAVCFIDEKIVNEVKNEHASDYEGLDWIPNGFVDASIEAKNSKK